MSLSSTAANTSDDAPKSTGARALAAVPVVLTVLATILAGLSSSEMTRSMYYRSLAAQNQAKAGSQWAFFQAKRIRGTTLESTSDLVRAWSDPSPLDAAQLLSAVERVESGLRSSAEMAKTEPDAANRVKAVRQKLGDLLGREDVRRALSSLTSLALPAIDEHHSQDATLKEVVQAVRSRQTEAQTAGLAAHVDPARLEEAIEMAEANAATFDQACQPITRSEQQIESLLAQVASELRTMRAQARGSSDAVRPLNDAGEALKESAASLRVARQDFTARRYAKEASYNQEAAELYEVLVRRNGFESDRHRERSRNFFYAMLCAQAGVTVASLALARSRMSFFWAVAGIAGSLALALGIYVYLAM